MRRLLTAGLLLLSTLALPAAATGATVPGTSSNFELVGRNGLFGRGMNSAPAIYKDYIYIGNRSDGTPGRPNPGISVVRIADPRRPRVVAELNPPDAGNIGESTRELRVWPQKRLLIVESVSCSRALHACTPTSVTPTFKFFDLTGRNAARPKLIATYVPAQVPHEFFLWADPKQRGRALIYYTNSTTTTTVDSLIAVDISRARQGFFRQISSWRGTHLYSEADRESRDIFLHSLDVSGDGKRTYLAHWGGGMLVLDTSDLAADKPFPEMRLRTVPAATPIWPNVSAHAVSKIPGRPFVLVGDEVFGTESQGIKPFFDKQKQGCPWGWVHVLDVANEVRPTLVGDYKIEENSETSCQKPESQEPRASFAAHNMTSLRNVAFATWYSGGLRAISLANPARPTEAGFYVPKPLRSVWTEDPPVTGGSQKVEMWSFPIIKDGLVYVVDVRNGLYILRYTGRFGDEVKRIKFLEGNSNLGDRARLERPAGRAR